MQAQYEQLAKEQFCKVMNAIPFVSDIEIISIGLQRRFGNFYAIVHFTDQEEPIRFCIEVKSNGEKRFVNMFMLQAGQHDEVCYVFMAPYISDESAEAMREGKCSYMDLSGNCYIITRGIFFYVRGQANKYIVKKEKKNYLSKSSGVASEKIIIKRMLVLINFIPLNQFLN